MILRTLSPTLDTLCLNFRDSHEVFWNFSPGSSAGTPPAYTEHERGSSRWIDLGSIFPRLTRLDFTNYFGKLTEYDLAGLPSTLKELCISKIESTTYAPEKSMMKMLPRNLERLEATWAWNERTIADWQFAPPNLAFVRCLTSNGLEYPNFAQWIPSNVKIDRLVTQGLWTPDAAQRFQTNVNQLEIQNDAASEFPGSPTAWIEAVPRSVSNLTILLSPPLLPDIIPQLPPHLTRLRFNTNVSIFSHLREAKNDEIDVATLWPKTLHTLSVEHNTAHDFDFRSIPRSLTSLEVSFFNSSPELKVFAAQLPPNLTNCSLRSSMASRIICNIVGSFTTSLKSFGNSLLFPRNAIEDTLPSSLTSLTFHMTSNPSPNEAAWVLPSQLISLSAQQWRVQWLEALPRHLTRLHIADLQGVWDSEPVDIFEHLPCSLTSLKLDSRLETRFTSTRSLASLTHLRDLDCSPKLSLPSSIWKNVPKSLRYLKIRLASDEAEDAPFLPSWLFRCALSGNINWKTTSLTDYWPPQAEPHGAR